MIAMRRPLFRNWLTDRAGSAMIEFAFAAPVLFMMTVGAVEFGVIMLTSTLMESSLREAARYGITGQEPDDAARLARIMEIIDARTLGLVDMNTASAQILTYPGFGDIGRGEDFLDANGNGSYDSGETFTDENGNGTWDDDVGASGVGGSGEIVVYRLTYDWEVWTPMAAKFVGTDGVIELGASIVVRNEPWESD